MLLTSLLLSLLSCIVAVAAAGQSCYTISGWKGGKGGGLPRKTSTVTLPATTTTLTRISKITTSTTLAAKTDTATVTETSTSTTTETSTSTIPAPAGFTPIYDSSGYSSLNSGGSKKREVLDVLLNRRQTSNNSRWPKGSKGPEQCKPQYVQCVTTVQRTSIIRTTVKVTTTSTIIPPDVTSTITATTTTTETTTSGTSFYAACATNNILGTQIAQGSQEYVQGVGNSDALGVQANVQAASAYECCVMCLIGSAGISNCQNTIYDSSTGNCNPIGVDTSVCPNGIQGSSGYVILTTDPMTRFDSNGPCGYLGPDPAEIRNGFIGRSSRPKNRHECFEEFLASK